jgi:outer membrane protein assembly factor BamA
MQKTFSVICILLLCSAVLAQTAPGPDTAKLSCGPAAEVVVRNLTVKDSAKLSPPDKTMVLQDIRSHTYRCDSLDEISERLREAYQEHGYFKTIVEEPVFTVLRQTGSRYLIDAVIAVEEGRLYRLGDITFTRGKLLSAEDLREQFPIPRDDIFVISKIRTGLQNLHGIYGANGYVDFTPVPDTKIDDASGLISVNIDLDEGQKFRYGSLIISGEEFHRGAKEELLKAWRAYQGTSYDPEALEDFLRDIHARPSIKPKDIFETSIDRSSGLINVHLTLVKPTKEQLQYLKAARGEHQRTSNGVVSDRK